LCVGKTSITNPRQKASAFTCTSAWSPHLGLLYFRDALAGPQFHFHQQYTTKKLAFLCFVQKHGKPTTMMSTWNKD